MYKYNMHTSECLKCAKGYNAIILHKNNYQWFTDTVCHAGLSAASLIMSIAHVW